eukprot:s684_g19.t1
MSLSRGVSPPPLGAATLSAMRLAANALCAAWTERVDHRPTSTAIVAARKCRGAERGLAPANARRKARVSLQKRPRETHAQDDQSALTSGYARFLARRAWWSVAPARVCVQQCVFRYLLGLALAVSRKAHLVLSAHCALWKRGRPWLRPVLAACPAAPSCNGLRPRVPLVFPLETCCYTPIAASLLLQDYPGHSMSMANFPTPTDFLCSYALQPGSSKSSIGRSTPGH